MDTDNQDNQNVLYNTANTPAERTTSDIISAMLAKYSLKETEEELTKKFFVDNKESNGGTVFWVASKLSAKEKTERDSVAILIEKLQVASQIAEQIIGDIKKNLVPILENKEPQKTEQNVSPAPLPNDIKKTIGSINNGIKTTPPVKRNRMPIQKNKMATENKISKKSINSTGGADKYRESIG